MQSWLFWERDCLHSASSSTAAAAATTTAATAAANAADAARLDEPDLGYDTDAVRARL